MRTSTSRRRPPFLSLLSGLALAALAACGQPGIATSTSSGGEGGGGEDPGQGGSGAGSSSTASSGGSGGGGPAQPLKVMNWNVQNLYNDVYDSGIPDEQKASTADYQEKLDDIAAVIKAMDPDVAVLQEVENMKVLEDLNAKLGGVYKGLAHVDSNDPRSIDVVALGRTPFDAVVSHKDEPFVLAGTNGPQYRFARDCVEMHVTVNGRHVVFLGVHFRSKGPPDDADKRLAEAQRTRAIADGIAAADPTAAIVVLGDFNDLPGSPPVRAVVGEGERAWKSVADEVPQGERWTFNYQGELELIDHQIANPVLASFLAPGGAVIRHGKDVEAASDHSPLMATYLVK